MKFLRVIIFFSATGSSLAGDLETMGVTLLRTFDASLQGATVEVGHPEAGGSDFEVNPAVVGLPQSVFTWISGAGSSSIFPNALGNASAHANTVGGNFYGLTNGVAPQIDHVDNYEVNWFINHFIAGDITVPGRVVNQSFIDNTFNTALDEIYDDYAAQHGTIFVSGISGVGGLPPLCSPGTCYNGIGVNPYGPAFVSGPTPDGRCKPDISAPDLAQAPNGAVSYSTAYVSGSAAVLVQAANRGDGGLNTAAASDLRTIKAMLLNGAIKPGDWTNSAVSPLDARYGAGIVNLFNSWIQLKGGKRAHIETTTVSTGTPHPPGGNPANELVLAGWNTNTLSTTSSVDKINHYYFNLTGSNSYTLTATLAWNRQNGETTINDLDLFLYDTGNSNLVASSISTVDNVAHIFVPQLPPRRYDLQVLKKGSGQVSNNEAYALAFEFFSMKLDITATNGSATFSWPASPTGFSLQSASSITSPISWSVVNAPVSVDTNLNQNTVTVPADSENQFFRLIRPPPGFGF